jgi:RHS repeat-associated protein
LLGRKRSNREGEAISDLKYTYDGLGRQLTETTLSGATSLFTWDATLNGIGKLSAASTSEGISRAYEYDSFGRVSAEVLGDGVAWSRLGYGYDGAGRVNAVRYPLVKVAGGSSSYQITLVYDGPSGALKEISDLNGKSLWKALSRNLDRQITNEEFGDGSKGSRIWEPERGLLTGAQVHRSADAADVFVSDLVFTYDALGYPTTRSDYVTGKSEAFIHDELGRLRHWSNSDNSWYVHYDYDPLGNMTNRSRYLLNKTTEETSFTMSPSRPHIATAMSIDGIGRNFGYDDIGRRKSVDSDAETVSYTDFDLPSSVTRASQSWAFKYDAFHSRVVKDGPSGRTVYLGRLYERRATSENLTHVLYVPGDSGNLIAQITQVEGTAERKLEYLHGDQIGSTTTITSKGAPAVRLAFEPFGARVDRSSPPSTRAINDSPGVTLGFAGHEQEDDLGFVNMKGRVYDPATARFLTADPVVSEPLNSQSLNPYSYALNSPLRYTDPTGLSPSCEDGEYWSPYTITVWADGSPSTNGACVARGPDAANASVLDDAAGNGTSGGGGSVGVIDSSHSADFGVLSKILTDIQKGLAKAELKQGLRGDESAAFWQEFKGGLASSIPGYVTSQLADQQLRQGQLLRASISYVGASAEIVLGGLSLGSVVSRQGIFTSTMTLAGEGAALGGSERVTLRLPASMSMELPTYRQAAEEGVLVKLRSSGLPRSRARQIWERAGRPVPEGFDVDHIIQRQFGGTDELWNLQLKPSGLNRREGPLARWLNRVPYGTIFNDVELLQ